MFQKPIEFQGSKTRRWRPVIGFLARQQSGRLDGIWSWSPCPRDFQVLAVFVNDKFDSLAAAVLHERDLGVLPFPKEFGRGLGKNFLFRMAGYTAQKMRAASADGHGQNLSPRSRGRNGPSGRHKTSAIRSC